MRRAAFLAVLGAAALIVHGVAQETTPRTWIKAGFVRPAADGRVAEGSAGGLGGTIYYAVYQLTPGKETTDDPYNTGLPDLASQFVAGTGSASLKSPARLISDTQRPRYLYLYQIVNDLGIDQASKDGIRLAANTEVKSRDIGSLVLKLPVDSRAISTWGYFKNTGFSLNAIDRGSSGKARPASLPPQMQMGTSANPSVLVKLNDLGARPHKQMAQPVEFRGAGFGVDRGSRNLDKSLFAEELTARSERLVAWEAESMKSIKSGGESPDAVELHKFSDNTATKPGSVLRATFASHALSLGKHSVLVGFTSDLPPGQDIARLQDVASAKKTGDAIRTVSIDDIDFGAAGMLPLPKVDAAPAVAAADATLGAGQRPINLVAQGYTYPGDIPANLIHSGTYQAFGGTVYFAVFRRVNPAGGLTTPPVTNFATGDTWGVGRSDFDSLFVPGESYRANVSPTLDTEAEYLYLYQVVNDRGFHDLNLPANKQRGKTLAAALAANADDDLSTRSAAVTREVASFSLFLRTDPRLITSWGYFDGSAFNIKVAETEARPVAAEGAAAKGSGILMAASSNLSILDTLIPDRNKVYRPWAPAIPFDFSRTSITVGKDTTNIARNRITLAAAGDESAGIRMAAADTLKKVAGQGANRPDYAQILYFDSRPTPELNLAGITLGANEVARGLFKVEWLNRPLKEGEHSVIVGFTSNAEPTRAPVRLKDLNATRGTSSELQERVFLSPERIKSIALAAYNASGASAATAAGQAAGIASGAARGILPAALTGDAATVAAAVASGEATGIVPASIATVAAGSAASTANGISLASGLPTPAEGRAGGEAAAGGGAGVFGMPSAAGTSGGQGGGLGIGGVPGVAGALGAARPASTGGGGGFGGGQGGGEGGGQSGADTGSDSGSKAGAGITNTINFSASLKNQQSQAQQQQQQQYQSQKQSQHQHQHQHNRGGHGHNGNVIPAPPSLLLGLLGLPGLWLVYRRRYHTKSEDAGEAPAV